MVLGAFGWLWVPLGDLFDDIPRGFLDVACCVCCDCLPGEINRSPLTCIFLAL